jgi:hypothetical protein
MIVEHGHRAVWPQALRRFLGVSIVANLVWEILQLPLYTLWATGTRTEQALAVLHCTVGDAMIAGLSLLAALYLFARATWPNVGVAPVYTGSLAFGVVYTIFSEWLNTSVRGNWAYSDLMPLVPGIGTGLAPLLQWFAVPTLALWIAVGRAPWIRNQSTRGGLNRLAGESTTTSRRRMT